MGEPMVQVIIRMPHEMREGLKRLAAANDRAMAAEVRRAVKAHIDAADFGRERPPADGDDG